MYTRTTAGAYHRLLPFHGFGAAADIGADGGGMIDGVDLSTIYQTDWPGVMNTAAQLWNGAQPLINGAQPLSPLAPSSAPALLQAPAASPSSSSPWLLIVGAAAIYYFILR